MSIFSCEKQERDAQCDMLYLHIIVIWEKGRRFAWKAASRDSMGKDKKHKLKYLPRSVGEFESCCSCCLLFSGGSPLILTRVRGVAPLPRGAQSSLLISSIAKGVGGGNDSPFPAPLGCEGNDSWFLAPLAGEFCRAHFQDTFSPSG